MAYIPRKKEGSTFKSIPVASRGPTKKKVLAQFAPIGGFMAAKHMALAARNVYGAKKVADGDDTREEAWPEGWTPIGDGYYGLQKQRLGRKKIAGDAAGVHSAVVLKFTGGKTIEPFVKGDIMIACRGTATGPEAQTDMNASKAIFRDPYDDKIKIGKTHAGFYHQYKSLFLGKLNGEDNLAEAVLREMPGAIYITGHSLGGAMSHLGALGLYLLVGGPKCAALYKIKQKPVPLIRVCSFAAPRVCNAHVPPNKLWQKYAEAVNNPSSRRIGGVRIVNMLDPVPNVPGQSLTGLRTAMAAVRKSKGAAAAPLAVALGGVMDALNLSSSLLQGRWSHPPFKKLRFRDNGKAFGHPHSMALYESILFVTPQRLALDLQDRF